MNHIILIIEKLKTYYENEFTDRLRNHDYSDGAQMYRDLTMKLEALNTAIKDISSEYHITKS